MVLFFSVCDNPLVSQLRLWTVYLLLSVLHIISKPDFLVGTLLMLWKVTQVNGYTYYTLTICANTVSYFLNYLPVGVTLTEGFLLRITENKIGV